MILVTGGTGFIGSHTCVALASAGHDFVILDNLSNSHVDVLDRIGSISGAPPKFVNGDIRDGALLDETLARYRVSAVMHFAGLKSVADSIRQPLEYYDTNVVGTMQLLAAMRRANVEAFIFSSSATVYGDAAEVPVSESSPCATINPYGRSKLIVEDILRDLHHAAAGTLRCACLRYFNPVGAHESALLGESPKNAATNLMPIIAEVAAGRRECMYIYGGDYATSDGTGVRDYIHVMDLAEGHVSALQYLSHHNGMVIANLGTGCGHTVLEVIAAFERASGRKIPYRVASRRPGDIAKSWADPTLARRLFGWDATRSLDTMCADAWRWCSAQFDNHPHKDQVAALIAAARTSTCKRG